jgi:vancomycin resistance protein VanW
MKYKTLIPRPLKLLFRRSQRKVNDYYSGRSQQFAKGRLGAMPVFEYSVRMQQPILESAFFENKVFNIQKAGKKINQVLIMPGEIFSFWEVVGYPGRWQGYRKGRNLVEGKLQSAYGGGLCQVSGILYHLALGTSLEILERHNHSVDIYSENERFAPLGSDATVVYGYKDLRFRNTTGRPLYFALDSTASYINACLHSPLPLAFNNPEFVRHDENGQRIVQTKVKGNVLAISKYRVPSL